FLCFCLRSSINVLLAVLAFPVLFLLICFAVRPMCVVMLLDLTWTHPDGNCFARLFPRFQKNLSYLIWAGIFSGSHSRELFCCCTPSLGFKIPAVTSTFCHCTTHH